MRPYHPCIRKQRRVVNPVDFIEKIFEDMFLQPSYEAKRDTECCKQQRESSSKSKKETEEGDSDTFTKQMMVFRSFKPEEIQIRVTKDKKVIVEAKQEMKKTDGDGSFQSYQMREFKQTVDVPDNVDIEQLASSISQEGLLTISAPFLALPEPEKNQKEEEMKLDEEPSDSSNEANDDKSESSKEDGSNMNNEST